MTGDTKIRNESNVVTDTLVIMPGKVLKVPWFLIFIVSSSVVAVNRYSFLTWDNMAAGLIKVQFYAVKHKI